MHDSPLDYGYCTTCRTPIVPNANALCDWCLAVARKRIKQEQKDEITNGKNGRRTSTDSANEDIP